MLMHYIANRISELLDRPVGRMVKKVKLSTILSLGDVKKKLDASALMKATKKYKVKKLFSAMMGAINLINPVYWIRKSVVNGALNVAIKKMCQAVISICGEETFKIYSKKVFNEENMIDLDTNKYIGELDESLKDVSDEEIDEYMKNEKLLLNLEEGDSHEGTNKN